MLEQLEATSIFIAVTPDLKIQNFFEVFREGRPHRGGGRSPPPFRETFEAAGLSVKNKFFFKVARKKSQFGAECRDLVFDLPNFNLKLYFI